MPKESPKISLNAQVAQLSEEKQQLQATIKRATFQLTLLEQQMQTNAQKEDNLKKLQQVITSLNQALL